MGEENEQNSRRAKEIELIESKKEKEGEFVLIKKIDFVEINKSMC